MAGSGFTAGDRHRNYIPLYGTVKRLTPKAILLESDDGSLWIPRSVVEEDTKDLLMEDEVELSVAQWFLEKENII